MSRTITEVQEDRNSLSVTKDVQGRYKYEVKIYFGQGCSERTAAVQEAEEVLTDLQARFEPEATVTAA